VKLGRAFRKKPRVDDGTLDRALAVPVPEGARDVPFDVRIPLTQATTVVVSHAFAVAILLGVNGVIVGAYTPTAPEAAAVSAALVLVLISSLVRGGLNPDRRLHVSEQGARVERLFNSASVPWWNVTRIRARPDLSELRVEDSLSDMPIQLSGMDEQARAAVLLALRARLEANQPIEAWRPSRLNRESAANVLGVAGSLLLVVSMYLHTSLGRTLGIRCSGPSSYLDQRFSLPSGPGCVVLRVSGAAARAGVRQGDRMIAMNGAPITSGVQFNNRFLDEASRSFVFTFVRRGAPQPIEIKVTPGRTSGASTPDTDPIAWFLRARGNPDREQGIEQYTRAISLAADFDLAYIYRGELLLGSGDVTQLPAVLHDFEEALTLNPNSAEANRALAEYYERQIFVDPVVPKTYAQRAIELDGCDDGFIGTNTDCEGDYVALASLLRFRADTPGSITAAHRAINFYPTASEPLYELALSYEVAHDTAQAAAYARQYLATGASDRTAYGTDGMRALLTRVGVAR